MEKFISFLLIASLIVVAKASFFDNAFGGDFNGIGERSVFHGNSDGFRSSFGSQFVSAFDRGADDYPSTFDINAVSHTKNGKIWGRPTKATTPRPEPEVIEKRNKKEEKLRKGLGRKPKRGPGSRTFDPSQRFDEYRRFKGPIKP